VTRVDDLASLGAFGVMEHVGLERASELVSAVEELIDIPYHCVANPLIRCDRSWT
jgi:hypothetical protein